MEIVDKYVKLVSDFVKIPIETIKSKWRKREVCEARQLISYILLLHTKLSLYKIAEASNYKSHASVLRDKKQVPILLDNDRKFAIKYTPLLKDAKELADKLEGKTNPVNIEKGDICWFWRAGQPLPMLGIFKSFHIDYDNNIWFRSEGESNFDFSSCKYVGIGILPKGFKRPAVIIPEEPEDISEIFYSESLIPPLCKTATEPALI